MSSNLILLRVNILTPVIVAQTLYHVCSSIVLHFPTNAALK